MDLDVTLPGEGGKDRPFKVSIKLVSNVSWHTLHDVLAGHGTPDPLELDKPISTNPVHAVDVVLRHLPSIKYVVTFYGLTVASGSLPDLVITSSCLPNGLLPVLDFLGYGSCLLPCYLPVPSLVRWPH